MTLYLALEGPDGGGKSTQATGLAEWLRSRGREVQHLREPGSTALGEGLRRLLLDPATGGLSGFTEALLFSAARAELVRQVIRPALARGTVVVCERCYLSTWVYQGVATADGEAPLALLQDVTRRALEDTWPDRVFVLDVPFDVGQERRSGQPDDRIEARGRAFHERVRDGYLRLARQDERCRVVDAARAADAVQEDLQSQVQELLSR